MDVGLPVLVMAAQPQPLVGVALGCWSTGEWGPWRMSSMVLELEVTTFAEWCVAVQLVGDDWHVGLQLCSLFIFLSVLL